MAIWGAAAGMGMDALGSKAKNDSALASAETQAYIEGLNRQFQGALFDSNQELSQPYLDFGYQGVAGLGQGGDYNFQGTPEFAYRQGLGNQAFANMAGVSPDVAQFGQGQMNLGLGLQEQDSAYNRLLDRAMIGQGQAGQAGGQAQQYGSALAQSYQDIGNMNMAAQQYQNQNTNNMYNTALGQASSIPAYMAQSNYLSGLGGMSTQQGFYNTPSYLERPR